MSKQIIVGGKGNVSEVCIGGGASIPIQSMWKKSLLRADLKKVSAALEDLKLLGLEIMRFAVPDTKSAEKLNRLSCVTTVPLVADIHFDYRLALQCMQAHIAAVRINPGNIGDAQKVAAVVTCAKKTGTPIRIGVNSGSLPNDLKTLPVAEALVRACEREMEIFDKLSFTNYAVSLKASNVEDTVRANEMFAKKYGVPIHLGVTEAGPPLAGAIKSTVACYRLLSQNIGDTIRVSLSGACDLEVIAAREILQACGKRKTGVTIISCPRCGRNGFDVHGFLRRWEKRLYAMQLDIKVAVMGCPVNGPGESKNADIGITGNDEFAIIFKDGKIVKRIDFGTKTGREKNKMIDEAFEYEIKSM